MSTEGNKRISQLVELTAGQIDLSDWMVVVDINSKESKKVKLSEFTNWFNSSASFFSVHAASSDTSSWSYNIVGGLVPSSSVASFSNQSVNSLYSQTSSFLMGGISSSVSSSWASSSTLAVNSITTSFLYYDGVSFNGSSSYAMTAQNVLAESGSWSSASFSSSYAINSDTSSITISSSHAINSNTSSFLYYDGFTFNGTSSYAISTSIITNNVEHAINADTASYVELANTASLSYQSNIANTSSVAYYLRYSGGPNGTASYAIKAGTTVGRMNNYGMYSSISQSISDSTLDVVQVVDSSGNQSLTFIDVWGDATLYFTSSVINYPSISLYIFDRQTGNSAIVDSSSIAFNTKVGGTGESGSLCMSFRLASQQKLNGYYLIGIKSTSPSLLLGNRNINYSISSYSDNLSVYAAESPYDLYIKPNSATATFYITGGSGPYTSDISHLLLTGSSNISSLDISNQSITTCSYTYHLTTMSYFNCSNNSFLTSLGYKMPDTLLTLSCESCSINYIYDLSNTQLKRFVCSNNFLNSLPNMPSSMSYLDCSSNPILGLPSIFPPSMSVFKCDGTQINTIYTLPNNVVTASFSGSSITYVGFTMPPSLKYINLEGNPITSLPIIGISCSYVNVASCSLTTSSLVTMTDDLISNNQYNGTLDIRGYGNLTNITLVSNISTLQSNGWTVLRDL
jgi:hypothetical protein